MRKYRLKPCGILSVKYLQVLIVKSFFGIKYKRWCYVPESFFANVFEESKLPTKFSSSIIREYYLTFTCDEKAKKWIKENDLKDYLNCLKKRYDKIYSIQYLN